MSKPTTPLRRAWLRLTVKPLAMWSILRGRPTLYGWEFRDTFTVEPWIHHAFIGSCVLRKGEKA